MVGLALWNPLAAFNTTPAPKVNARPAPGLKADGQAGAEKTEAQRKEAPAAAFPSIAMTMTYLKTQYGSLQFTAANPTSHVINGLPIRYELIDSTGNVVYRGATTLDFRPSAAKTVMLLTGGLPQIAAFRIDRADQGLWPNACTINGAAARPWPIALEVTGARFQVVGVQ